MISEITTVPKPPVGTANRLGACLFVCLFLYTVGILRKHTPVLAFIKRWLGIDSHFELNSLSSSVYTSRSAYNYDWASATISRYFVLSLCYTDTSSDKQRTQGRSHLTTPFPQRGDTVRSI